MKKHPTETNKHSAQGHAEKPTRSDSDAASLLLRIEHRLFHLERKIESIISMMQGKQFAGISAADKPFRKKFQSKRSPASDHPNSRRVEKRSERPGGKDTAKPFYSKFSKSKHSGFGSGSKPYHRKPGKQD